MSKKIQQIQQIKKDKFVAFYRESRGHISNCARAVGIDRGTYYNWLEKDDDFARDIAEAEAELNDDMKELLIQNAADNNMTAIIFYLKNRHPEFKQSNNTNVQVNIANIVKDDMKEYE